MSSCPSMATAAVGYTATYVRGGRVIRIAPVFVTVYQKGTGLAETVRQSLRGMQAYTFEVAKDGGAYVYRCARSRRQLVALGQRATLIKLGVPTGRRQSLGSCSKRTSIDIRVTLTSTARPRRATESAGPAAVASEGPAQP